MRWLIVGVTYPAAIIVGIVLGLWVAGLKVVGCPPRLTTGVCLPEPRLSSWEAALVGLAAAAALTACGVAADVIVARRRRR
jgi:hypothetical protein